MPLRPVMTDGGMRTFPHGRLFFAPCRRAVGAGPPGGVDLGTAFLHHLDRKAFQEYFAK